MGCTTNHRTLQACNAIEVVNFSSELRQEHHVFPEEDEDADVDELTEFVSCDANEHDDDGEAWIAALLEHEYSSLSLHLRVALLCSLCQLAIDSPTIRFAAMKNALL